MKTTVEIDDELLRRAKVHAAEQGTTLRSVLEDALERLLQEWGTAPTGYRMADRRVHGHGLRPEYEGWTATDLIYASYEEHDLDRR